MKSFIYFNLLIALIILGTCVNVIISSSDETVSSALATSNETDNKNDTASSRDIQGRAGDRAKIKPCHSVPNNASLAKNETLVMIDAALDSLYGSITRTAKYMDNCTYYAVKEGDDEGLSLISVLERFEVFRRSYEFGVWGYCAQEGATDLINKINWLATKAQTENFTMCDREQLLGCHRNYSKCVCLMDSWEFRTIAAENEGGTDESSDCTLITSSDCSLNPHSPYHMCNSEAKCRLKENKNKECTLQNLRGKTVPESEMETLFPKNESTQFRMLDSRMPSIHCECYKYFGGSSSSRLQLNWGILMLTVFLSSVMNYDSVMN